METEQSLKTLNYLQKMTSEKDVNSVCAIQTWPFTYELKIGTQVTPTLYNIHNNFVFFSNM